MALAPVVAAANPRNRAVNFIVSVVIGSFMREQAGPSVALRLSCGSGQLDFWILPKYFHLATFTLEIVLTRMKSLQASSSEL